MIVLILDHCLSISLLSGPLTDLFNISLIRANSQAFGKRVNVTPAFKKNELSDAGNFRPNIGKDFEKKNIHKYVLIF